jgi:hypothetical protein
LRHVKTDENVARTKSLLSDTGFGYHAHADGNKGLEIRVYGVRGEAYQALKSWG